jgi:hypothetical protein
MKKYSQRILEEKEEKITLDIQISNLKPHQAEQLKNLLFAMDMAGAMGCSRTFKCYVDGDGGFRPTVLIDDQPSKDFKAGENVDFEKDTLEFGFE